MHRGLMTDAEAQEINKMEPERRRDILAQSTVESVTAYQLPLRQKRRDRLSSAKPSDKGAKSAAGGTIDSQPADAGAEEADGAAEAKVDQVIYLKDFPQTALDVKALVKFGFESLHAAYLIEENFVRDIDGDEEEKEDQPVQDSLEAKVENAGETTEGDQEPKKVEKLHCSNAERAQTFVELVELNRVLKSQPLGS